MLWRIRGARHHGRAFGTFVLVFLLASGFHFVWDGSRNPIVHLGVAAIGFVALMIFILLSHHRPRRVRVG
jgi:hypothetical protein